MATVPDAVDTVVDANPVVSVGLRYITWFESGPIAQSISVRGLSLFVWS